MGLRSGLKRMFASIGREAKKRLAGTVSQIAQQTLEAMPMWAQSGGWRAQDNHTAQAVQLEVTKKNQQDIASVNFEKGPVSEVTEQRNARGISGEAQNKHGSAAEPPSESELTKSQEKIKIKPTEESSSGSNEALKKLGARSNSRPDGSPDDSGHQRAELEVRVKAAVDKANSIRGKHEVTKASEATPLPTPAVQRRRGPKHSR
jgi:hypothetical protein